ncbi:hypothetical protein J2Z32_002514 [Paenibacillus turicensis]|uniref:General stress protein n=1 Tax=Paenibacillus turicensis TaxID=160487 RepID=A0ABS4FTI0_9BACL|nr:general stress protein [Paenibacillus turicensis]MBP1905866.1 hypothetical protein [Paenibacillus turicensis]
MKIKLEKRLAYLYSGELVSLIMFIPVSFGLNYGFPNLMLYSLFSFWTSFLLLEFILLQGTIYWREKLKRLRNNDTLATPLKLIRQLTLCKRINIIIIGAGIFAFVLDFIRWHSALPSGGLLLAIGIYVFALLEFINYYYIQLSYDNRADIRNLLKNRRLKRACINKEIKRCLGK